MLRVIALALFLATAYAASCDNGCSGHGVCGQNGICACYDNWGVGLSRDSGDCSERICPFEFAWVDTPDEHGSHHKYAECSNRGICDRESGECECFPGYEGKACARTACPNDCSGHGRCKAIEDMPWGVTAGDWAQSSLDFFDQKAYTFDSAYYKWDKDKTMGCVCDPQYTDVDCSKRMCQHGNDIMDQRDNLLTARSFHVQHILLQADVGSVYQQTAGALGGPTSLASLATAKKTFALSFTSKMNETFTTIPLVFPGNGELDIFTKAVESALESLPNKVIDDVHVAAAFESSFGYGMDYANLDTTVDNTANDLGLDGNAAYDNTNEVGLYMNITFTGENVQGPQNLLTVRHYLCGDGCTPKLSGLELEFGTHVVNSTDIGQNDGSGWNTHRGSDYNSYECGRRGKCDYTTGQCECFSGYTGLACGTITSLV
mmetsp:Transcript_33644/g.44416  ORF Transcript_33644/g.44416 Transcript_33644/m.44416 type:complete len:432 (-) Transcript_33644:188-1483(-)